jgi:phage-related protein (TIGR01555 family)
MSKRSIERVAKKVRSADNRARASVGDTFQNFAAKLGLGTDNVSSGSGYGFNPISRVRPLLEWIHRGSWLGGVAVDLVADDMTRAGVEFKGELDPADAEKLEEAATLYDVWGKINEVVKWSRLYGGAIGVIMVDGQDPATAFDPNRVGKRSFRGLLVLDRWMVDPSLNDLVTDPGRDLGLPKFYTITADSPALPRKKVHYTRCIRLEGIKLPYWQRIQENLWGISVLERLYDRMVAFDSSTTGAAQLVYKAYIRTYKVDELRETIATGGPALDGLVKYVEMMRRFQSVEGVTLIDAKDDMIDGGASGSFAGISEVLLQLGQQLSGALQIPLVRLFGQSPAGLNSSGESDLRTYYDGIRQKQIADLLVPMTKVFRAIALSEGVKLDDGFGINFNPLWQLKDEERAAVAGQVVTAVTQAHESGLITRQVGMKELKQNSRVTNVFTNISAEDIEDAEDEENLAPEAEVPEAEGAESRPTAKVVPIKKPGAAGDGLATFAGLSFFHDLAVVIENPKGTLRSGIGWSALMPADYGYLRLTRGADGDQVDCFLGEDSKADKVWVINRQDPVTKAFDEHKVMLGFSSDTEAMKVFTQAYDSPQHLDGVVEFSLDEFKRWLAIGDLSKPA